MKRLYRSTHDKMLAGVCAGLAEYWDVDPSLIRLAVVFIAIITAVIPALLVYILAAIIIPVRPQII